jgi:hypothetical protein
LKASEWDDINATFFSFEGLLQVGGARAFFHSYRAKTRLLFLFSKGGDEGLDV